MSTVQTSIENRIAIIKINRPEQLNALSMKVLLDLKEAFQVVENDANVGVIILTGEGEKAFIAGADIKEMSTLSSEEALSYAKNGQALTSYIENFSKPVIAAINGFALGGGCEFAMACHIRYASETARLGQPEVGLGLIAGFGGTQRLPRLVGKGRALEILLSGGMLSASDAKEMGLLNAIFPQEILMKACMKLASKILRNGPIALRETIYSVNEGLDLSVEDGLKQEAQRFGTIFESEDQTEGTTAFVEKRPAKFTGK
ncbi:MAG: enoyl-CoA hydratase/isomerase family protein [Candidatus Marinimicrobia bacterium]|nr:enoyl-CoA hydratase/isomerase family protein [Candidatus Neomarinimicrobiota bacterium]